MSTLKSCLNGVGLAVLLLASCRLGRADEVTDWNRIMLEATLVSPATPAPLSTRTTAIVQAAVFDAVNGIERHYTPIHVNRTGPRNASQRAATVQAAYATLIRLYPAQSDMLGQQRSTSLAAIARGWDAERSESIQKGIEWGQTVADAIWAWRSNDGFAATPPPFVGGTAPGEWRPTSSATGLAPQLAQVTPWVMQSPSQFRPAGPPALDSLQYTADFNEIKTLGSISGTSRTPDETAAALFWNPGNPPDFWDPVGVALAQKHHFGLLRTAHLLAQMNLAMSDAMIGCWDAKYTFVSWRPVTAIRLADTDGNPDTVADPTWTPLLATPPFPGYPSAHSCASAAAVRVLSKHFGGNTAITVTNDALPGQTRSFGSFSAALAELVEARVFGGIHFRTDCDAGQALGESVGEYVIKHSLRSIDGWERRDDRGGDWGH